MTPDRPFLAAARGFVELVEHLEGADLAGPGLGDWDLRSLVGHASRSVLTVQQYLRQPAPRVEVARPADYFIRVRELTASLGPADVTERGRAAGAALGDDPAAVVRRMVQEVAVDLAAVEGDPVITTIAGGMHLSAYLPTRTFELVVHGIDIAAAGRMPWQPADDTLAAAIAVATETSIALGGGVALLRALTGRGGEIASVV
jgi:hypothetical protein